MSDTDKDLRDLTHQLLITTGHADDEWAVFYRRTGDTPDHALTITVYDTGAPHTWGVQVRVRGDADNTVSAADKAHAIRHALHGLTDLAMGATQVELLRFVSLAPMGVDANGREELAVNLHALTSDPAAALYHD